MSLNRSDGDGFEGPVQRPGAKIRALLEFYSNVAASRRYVTRKETEDCDKPDPQTRLEQFVLPCAREEHVSPAN
ncbi:hypothetical protein Mal48_19770 [Thalassoglobus polymorphus]|uniref:Uncharacterized protein n=1 Tax=Thalassoglobus polymorphus TaxID=2527994 RepID=A0A517QM72_9PLAN|nr:hypothetical protein Mal48_19770 [Thalassoglobus polymorphus]